MNFVRVYKVHLTVVDARPGRSHPGENVPRAQELCVFSYVQPHPQAARLGQRRQLHHVVELQAPVESFPLHRPQGECAPIFASNFALVHDVCRPNNASPQIYIQAPLTFDFFSIHAHLFTIGSCNRCPVLP